MIRQFEKLSLISLALCSLVSIATVQSQQLPELVARNGYAETIFVNGKSYLEMKKR